VKFFRMKTKDDGSFDFQAGLSLLLVRPTVLLSSIHHLIILIGLHLSSSSSSPSNPAAVPSHSFSSTPHRELPTTDVAVSHLEHELSVVREVMEKVRGLEGKVSYQVKKLVALADTNKEVPGGADAKQNGANTGAENADDEDAEANGESCPCIRLSPAYKTRELNDPLSSSCRPALVPTEPVRAPRV
jgi:hypothetical protein